MKGSLDKERSIAKHIIDGTLTIDSITEFKGMLRVFPDNPALHSAFAELLSGKNRPEDAADAYARTAELYIVSGKMMSAVLAKIMEWRIRKPTHQQAREFFSNLRETKFADTPWRSFLNRLSYSELVALTNRMARVSLPNGKVIKKVGDTDAQLHIIAAGAVRETIYDPPESGAADQQKTNRFMTENDLFGDAYPFGGEKRSRSHIETLTRVELARISESRLQEVCQKYPNVEQALVMLFEDLAKTAKEANRGTRKAGRQPLPIRLNLEIFPEASDAPIVLEGFSRDISVGGVCVVVDSKYANISASLKMLASADIQVCFPSDALKLNVAGKIVWSRGVTYEGEKTLALGIQFKDMTPRMSGMLFVFADMIYQSP